MHASDLEDRPFDIPVNVLDVTRADKILGWRARLSFEQGVEIAARDLRKNEIFSTLCTPE